MISSEPSRNARFAFIMEKQFNGQYQKHDEKLQQKQQRATIDWVLREKKMIDL